MLKNLTMSFSGPTKKKVHNDNETNKSVNTNEKIANYLEVLKDENLPWRKHIVTVGH